MANRVKRKSDSFHRQNTKCSYFQFYSFKRWSYEGTKTLNHKTIQNTLRTKKKNHKAYFISMPFLLTVNLFKRVFSQFNINNVFMRDKK